MTVASSTKPKREQEDQDDVNDCIFWLRMLVKDINITTTLLIGSHKREVTDKRGALWPKIYGFLTKLKHYPLNR
jgi:hypothetical protein